MSAPADLTIAPLADAPVTVHPGTPVPATVDCRRDHRIAMSFSVLGLRAPGIALDDPACVGKTFPGFHAELARLFGSR